ncbi:SAM-dependent methyltransferase [Halorhodospira halophila]|uniref:SAM-dependent methyltransferase n=1 Tax=Halorhodospira halophila TaxID=1053 RepID=UPI00031840B7|nr:methyltransferase domain-containing protein [Halorhodospira halophila]
MIAPCVARLERWSARWPLLFHLYALPYRRLVARELRLAGVVPGERLLHVGCGALPFTAVLAARLSGARVTAVDRSAAAVAGAQAVVAHLGMAGAGPGRVRVVCADAAADPLPEIDVALIALQACPRGPILANIRRQRAPARVLFRLPRPGLEGQYGGPLVGESVAGSCRHRMPTFDRTELFLHPAPVNL